MCGIRRFLGHWHLTREISGGGRFDGVAVIAPDGAGGAVYDEEGVLSLPGQPPFQATRRYLWRQEGDGIAVCFADGRFFHRFDPAMPAPQARHLCPPDLYDVTYDFTDWPRWSALWRVEGPRKSYVMRSDYVAAALTAPGQDAMALP
ncbi:hypothetical protein SAMN05421538_10239 [Paracoccus isoporae]|uniref:DUF6314 domain-containing protein n=1 Tax=Paracoccus isoporae TaxID=591205 RepID=A0A1G6W564_9RHOB|nr:DUF6314 family protein [Paracoccus isoporae]SDD60833.1 hypothetical protein SAMN05421538_10239 [Paracoccus isoporae]